MISFSVSSPSVVGLRLPFLLFVIVPVLSYRSPVRGLLESVPAPVQDGLLRLCEAENSVLPPLGEKLHPDHQLLGRRRARNDNISPSR